MKQLNSQSIWCDPQSGAYTCLQYNLMKHSYWKWPTIYCHLTFIPGTQISVLYTYMQKQYEFYNTNICCSLKCKHFSHFPPHRNWSYKGCGARWSFHFNEHPLFEFVWEDCIICQHHKKCNVQSPSELLCTRISLTTRCSHCLCVSKIWLQSTLYY